MHAVLREDSGGDGPPLVYVPGIDGSGALLLDTAERLEQRFRLIRLAYVGESQAGEDGYGILADSVARCIGDCGIERALLVAESFGVAVALRTALDHAERIAGLALVNGFAYFDRRFRLSLSATFAPLVRGPLFTTGRRLFAAQMLFRPRKDPAALRAFRAVPALGFGRAYRDRLALIRGLDLRPRLAEIRQPVALFAADRDQVVDAICAAELMHAKLPDSTLEVLPRAGHLVLPLNEEPWVERMVALQERATRDRSPAP